MQRVRALKLLSWFHPGGWENTPPPGAGETVCLALAQSPSSSIQLAGWYFTTHQKERTNITVQQRHQGVNSQHIMQIESY